MRTLPFICLLSACSLGMKSVPSGWDGTYEPDCTDNPGPVIGDAILAGAFLAVGAIAGDESVAAKNEGSPNIGADVLAIGGFALALGFTISAIAGESRYKECKNTKSEWRLGQAIGAGTDKRVSAAEQGAARAREALRAQQEANTKAAAQPRGFFCSSNATVSFCVRDKAECERTRDVAALPDLTPCTLVESAWCFGDHCSTTQQSCSEQSAKTGLTCAEVR